MIAFFQAPDRRGQGLGREEAREKEKRKNEIYDPPDCSFYVVGLFPILEVHDTLRNGPAVQSSDLHAKGNDTVLPLLGCCPAASAALPTQPTMSTFQWPPGRSGITQHHLLCAEGI